MLSTNRHLQPSPYIKPNQNQCDRRTLGVRLDVLRRRPNGLVRRSEVALVEHAQLIGRERADDRVQNATVVEENEIVLVPVVRVDELYKV